MNTLISRLAAAPWYITGAAYTPLAKLTMGEVNGERELNPDADGSWWGRYVHQRKPLEVDPASGIATISVVGPVAAGLTAFERDIGYTDLRDIEADIESARGMGATGYFFDIASPGGTVHGTPEAARAIAEIEEPTAAYTDDLMASAAYYLAAGADRVSSSLSASVGSIGVFIPWIDAAALWEAFGYKWDPVISTGSDLKAAGAGPSLTKEHREHFQEVVDEALRDFAGHVLAHRSVDKEAMRGQVLRGARALELGLVDSIESKSSAYRALLDRIDE